MKHTYSRLHLLIACLLIHLVTVNGQNFLVEIKPGVSFSKTDQSNYSGMKSMPCKVLIGGGLTHLQAGLETNFQIVPPTYYFYDPFVESEKRAKEVIKEKYYGGFLRFNTAKNPRENVGFIMKAGVGQFKATKKILLLPSNNEYQELDYEPALEFNGEMGLAIPIPEVLCLTIQYGFSFRKYKMLFQDIELEKFTMKSHTIYVGVALHI